MQSGGIEHKNPRGEPCRGDRGAPRTPHSVLIKKRVEKTKSARSVHDGAVTPGKGVSLRGELEVIRKPASL